MKLAAYILLLGALGLICVAGWALFTQEGMWGYRYDRVVAVTTMVAMILSFAASYLFNRARRRQGFRREVQSVSVADGSSREWATAGGVGVILVTGFAAFGDGSGFFDGSPVNAALGVLVVVLTLGGAFALHRFIARHGDEIGEARFDTRNKDESRP
jgi:drug/metabolite transporter (DMT)-like permease